MNLLPYQPTQAEIDSLQGLWLCYTGSPQARISDANRYHKVVSNLVNISYKNGYFTFDIKDNINDLYILSNNMYENIIKDKNSKSKKFQTILIFCESELNLTLYSILLWRPL